MLALFLLTVSPTWAIRPYTPVYPDPVLESWRWRSFPELNGLGLRRMAEAKDKAMWFGVDDGVRRYDGVKWTAYMEKDGLYGAPVTALCATRDGSVYAGTLKGISRFREGKWSRVFPPEGDMPWPISKLMEARDGSVWAGTGWGALRFAQEGPMLYTTEQMGAALRTLAPYVRLSIVPEEAAPARLWGEGIGAMATSSLIFGGGSAPMVIWRLASGGPGEVAGLKVGDRIVAVDGQPDVSPGRLNGPASTSVRLTIQREGRPEPFEVTVTRRRVEGTYRSFLVYDVYEDRDGAIWFGSVGGEVVRYTPLTQDSGLGTQDSQWRLYTEKDGLDIGFGPRIVQTRDGIIWTVSGNAYHGVNRFDGRRWTHFRLSDLGGNDINTSILETADGTLWVGGHLGCLHAYRDGRWMVYRPTPDVPIPQVRIIGLVEASDGALWMGGLGQEALRLDFGTARWRTYEGLSFQCETPDGAQWFVSRDSSVVRYDGQGWMRYGVEDGLVDAPYRLIVTRKGDLWAAGSHNSTAATARFDGKKWSFQTHPRLSWGIDLKAVYESLDGSLYFGAAVGPNPQRGQGGGVLRFDGKTWLHYTPPEAYELLYGIGQTADGVLYFGGVFGLRRFDGRIWASVTEPEELSAVIDEVYATPKGDLWVGTRTYGAFHYDGKSWTHYDVQDGLADNRILSILQISDGSVWVGTDRGISRFDGRTWTTHTLPPDLRLLDRGGSLRQSRDGALWINRALPEGKSFRWLTTRYEPDRSPPETEITASLDKVSQPGNTVLAWKGASPWKATPDEEVQYSYRMDRGEWSPFSAEKNKVFLALSSGAHTFEVRARDRDFNVDPTPAAIRFTVVPPVWRQPWFIGLMAVLLSAVGLQTARVVRRDRRLRESNLALSAGNKELFALNRGLMQERAVERVRAEVTAMKQAEDLKDVVAEMLRELAGAGVEFDLCVINIVDEEAGVRRQYGATKEGWSGQSEEPVSKVSEAFRAIWKGGKPVVRQVDDGVAARHFETRKLLGIAGEAGRPTALVDAPFAYGTLSLSTRRPGGFREEDVALVEEFARVMALGYARYLDFQRLEEKNRALEKTLEEKEQAQEMLVRSESMAAIGTLVAGVAHELNNPLGAASSLVQSVQEMIQEDSIEEFQQDREAILGHLAFSRKEMGRIKDIVASLLDLSRQTNDYTEPVKLDVVARDALRVLYNKYKRYEVNVEEAYQEGLPQIAGNFAQLGQVCLNIIQNAIDALDGKGKIVLKTYGVDRGSWIVDREKASDESRITNHESRDGGGGVAWVVFECADTGPGMSEEVRRDIFKPFFTTKPPGKGTGLGLYICHQIVEKHGGTIEVDSAVGKGTTFRIRLPITR